MFRVIFTNIDKMTRDNRLSTTFYSKWKQNILESDLYRNEKWRNQRLEWIERGCNKGCWAALSIESAEIRWVKRASRSIQNVHKSMKTNGLFTAK